MNSTAYRPWQIRIFAATWLSYAGYYFCRQPFSIVKSTLNTELGIGTRDLAHMWTAYLVAYMVGQFSSAYFGRKLGSKILLLVGMAISIAAALAFGVSNGFWSMLIFLSINGLAQGTGWPGCIGSLAYWFKRRERGSVLGVWSTCYQLGAVGAKAYAAYLLGVMGWRWSFFGGALILIAVWVLVSWLHPNTPEDVGLEPLHEDNGTESGTGNGLGWTRDVVVAVLTMGLVYFCIKFLRYALWSWTPFLLNRNFGLEKSQAGYLSTVFDLAGFVGVIAAGFISDRLFNGRRAFITLLLMMLMSASFVLMYYWGTTDVVIFALTIGMVGFALYGPDSLLSGVGAIDIGSERGALVAAGIINGMGSIGPIFQEELIGWMYEAFGQQLFPIVALLVGIALLGTFVMAILCLQARRGRISL